MRAVRLLALAAWAILPETAGAQCRSCARASTAASAMPPGGDVQLELATTLNFDRLILLSPGSGAATIRPDGSSSAEGVVMGVGARATVGNVIVHGEPNRAVHIDLPNRIRLFSANGGEVILDNVSADVSTFSRLDSAGNLSFRFGGRLVVSGDCDGPFRGDLPISVEYQ